MSKQGLVTKFIKEEYEKLMSTLFYSYLYQYNKDIELEDYITREILSKNNIKDFREFSIMFRKYIDYSSFPDSYTTILKPLLYFIQNIDYVYNEHLNMSVDIMTSKDSFVEDWNFLTYSTNKKIEKYLKFLINIVSPPFDIDEECFDIVITFSFDKHLLFELRVGCQESDRNDCSNDLLLSFGLRYPIKKVTNKKYFKTYKELQFKKPLTNEQMFAKIFYSKKPTFKNKKIKNLNRIQRVLNKLNNKFDKAVNFRATYIFNKAGFVIEI